MWILNVNNRLFCFLFHCDDDAVAGNDGHFRPGGDAVPVLRYGLPFVPVHLGPSRLRTETAALTAVEAVYLKNI